MLNEIRYLAAAKINLYLRVLRRLPNGYHEIDTVMQAVSLFDEVILSPRERGIKLTCSDISLAREPIKNLAFRAAALFYQRCPNIRTGVNITLKKNIPIAAGLAGGSADAAAVLVGMNLLFGAGLSEAELCGLGVRIGMDVPFCIMGGIKRGQGMGERLSECEPMPDCRILIAIGAERINTAEAYKRLSATGLKEAENTMIPALESGSLENVCQNLYNSFETVTESGNQIKQLMLENGASGALMSGSGPAVFGLFRETPALERARAALAEKKYTTFVCRAIN